jgi:hypothetical protein
VRVRVILIDGYRKNCDCNHSQSMFVNIRNAEYRSLYNTCKTSCICIFTFTLTVYKQTDINKVCLYGNQDTVNVINQGFM